MTVTSAAAGLLRLGVVVTTKTLAERDCRLEVQCRGCLRETVLAPHELLRMFPKATPLREAGKRLRCERCGAHNPRMWILIMGWTRDKRRRRS